MCGIAGILNLDSAPGSAPLARRMSAMIAHRGPDGEGVFADGPLALGHRRLAIIDLTSAAHQPMQSHDGRYVLGYNGEIYNFQELRAELQALGYPFRSQSDTEVLLNGYAAWGEKVLGRLNGMFAFALWDTVEQCLFLARDRYGIKPLYLARLGDTLLFASEIKAFLVHPKFRSEIDKEGLVEYLTFQNFFTERTLFRGVTCFPAGSCLYIDTKRKSKLLPKPRIYWDYHFNEPGQPASREEYLEELNRLFAQGVKRQLVSDVELGSYLSGGMDSGSITSIAAAHTEGVLKTFTIGFDLHSASGLEYAFDERERAEHMSYLFKTEHYEMVLKAGDMERCMRNLVWHLEEPRVGQSYPNYYAAYLAGKFCSVVLSGAGGDELFGGYPWRYYRAVVNDSFDQYVGKYFDYWQRLVPADQANTMFAPVMESYRNIDLREIFSSVFRSHADHMDSPEGYVNHSLYFEAKTFLHGIFMVDDKLSMAHSLESRVPFMDNDLVDFAQHVPVSLKLGNLGAVASLNENEPGPKTARYFEKTRDGKLILREAMARHMPESITSRIKQGFSAPDAGWFKGESMDYVRRRLLGRSAAIHEYLDRDTVHSLITDHLEGRQNRRLLIWSLLNLEEWLDVFTNGGWQDNAVTE